MVRRALAAALLVLALLPAVASAHATLQATVPERGAKLDAAPSEVVFRFDEAVEASFGALRVFDSRGQEVQTGEPFHPGGKGSEIATRLKPGLGDGTYTATYRVVSADGHPISSGFVFVVGEASAPTESLDQLLAGGGTGSVTTTALSVARAVQYAAIALGLGALIFFLYCWRGSSTAFTRRLERILLAAAIAGLLSAVAALVLQGAVGQGGSFWAAAKPDVVGEVLGTRFGRAWGVGALAWIAVLVVLATRPLRPRGDAVARREPVPAGDPAPALVGARASGDAARARRPTRRAGRRPPPTAARPPRPRAARRRARHRRRPRPRATAPVAAADSAPRAAARRAARRPRAARPPPRASPRSRSPSSPSRCCPRSAATRACSSRSRSCCRRTSCTCWP